MMKGLMMANSFNFAKMTSLVVKKLALLVVLFLAQTAVSSAQSVTEKFIVPFQRSDGMWGSTLLGIFMKGLRTSGSNQKVF
jgi:hypothetical protein